MKPKPDVTWERVLEDYEQELRLTLPEEKVARRLKSLKRFKVFTSRWGVSRAGEIHVSVLKQYSEHLVKKCEQEMRFATEFLVFLFKSKLL